VRGAGFEFGKYHDIVNRGDILPEKRGIGKGIGGIS